MKSGLVSLVLLPVALAQPPAATNPAGPAAAGPVPVKATPAPAAPARQPAPAPATEATAAPADPLEALAKDSPFLPASGSRATAAGPTGPLELRSIVFVDGQYRFSIYDQGTSEANWVGIGERGYPFVARSFDRERDTLTVEHQGRPMVLTLQPARMASSGHAQTASPSPLPGPNNAGNPNNPTNPTNRRNTQGPGPGMSAGPQPVNNAPGSGGPAVNAPNATEAQRLQNLADEIRRRRNMGGSRINLPESPNRKN